MSIAAQPRVVCVGVVTWDAVAAVDRYPREDERVVAETIAYVGGGPAATAAVVLARQGVPVSFVGRVGADAAGEHALASLAGEGVDVSGVEISTDSPTQTSCIIVSTASQTRAICTLDVPALASLTPTGQQLIRSAEWVHADHLGFAALVSCLPDAGSRPRICVDAGNPVPLLDYSMVDLFVPTVGSLGRHTAVHDDPATAAHRILAAGTSTVVATDGAKGSHAWWNEQVAGSAEPQGRHVHVPGVSSVPIRSTLGAGDVFHGALLAAVCRGESWEQALRSANATAALSCRALDGQSAIPNLSELTDFLRHSSHRSASPTTSRKAPP